jgi:hypothetical protein
MNSTIDSTARRRAISALTIQVHLDFALNELRDGIDHEIEKQPEDLECTVAATIEYEHTQTESSS